MNIFERPSPKDFPSIDIHHIPFSRYGAYIGISDEENKLVVYNARLRFWMCNTYEITFWKDGKQLEFQSEVTPDSIRIFAEGGRALIYIQDDYSFIIKSEKMDVRIYQVSTGICYGVKYGGKQIRTIAQKQNTYTLIHPYLGNAEITPAEEGSLETRLTTIQCENEEVLALVSFDTIQRTCVPEKLDVEKDVAEIRNEWQKFFSLVSANYNVSDEYSRVTWYNLWSSFARARGVYHYDTMLMSKKLMSSVWSWDHCFNALAICEMNPRAALEQFMAPFVLQDRDGLLPDMWNPDHDVMTSGTKPPIHGWCFSKLMDQYDYSAEDLRMVYNGLEKWTNWWFRFRDPDGNGIPDYPRGCDSGWDNSTVFDIGFYIESPDLSAFLFLQMKCLEKIANKLGDAQNADYWKQTAESFLQKFYDNNWVNNRFVARISTTGEYDPNPTSSLVLMPIVLGDYLDQDKMDRLVEILENDLLTENGMASESVKSPLYTSDGYWRGPIWAPTTYLIVDGLRRGGHADLAEKIAKAYIHMTKDLAHGNYENFDAVTGKGLRAPGYTWSASVYSMLWNEYYN